MFMLAVGIDWAEEFHDVALGRPCDGVFDEIHVDHTPAAIDALIARIAALEPDADLSRVGLQGGDTGDPRVNRSGCVVDMNLVEHAIAWPTQRHVVELLGPVDSYCKHEHPPPYRLSRMVRAKARRRADGPVLAGQHPCGRQAFGAVLRGRRLMSVLEGQASEAFPAGDPYV